MQIFLRSMAVIISPLSCSIGPISKLGSLFLGLLSLLVASYPATAQEFEIDPSFRTGKGFVTDRPKVDDPPGFYDVTSLRDGTILVSHFFKDSYDGKQTGSITAITQRGKNSRSFKARFGGLPYKPLVLTMYTHQIDGVEKVLVEGRFKTVNGVRRNGLARLNSDGSVDTSFDPGIGASERERNPRNGRIILYNGAYLIQSGIAIYQGVRLQQPGLFSVDLSGNLLPHFQNFPAGLEVFVDRFLPIENGVRAYGTFFDFSAPSSSDVYSRVATFDSSLNIVSRALDTETIDCEVNSIRVLSSGAFYQTCNYSSGADGSNLDAQRLLRFGADGVRETGFKYDFGVDTTTIAYEIVNPDDEASDLILSVLGKNKGTPLLKVSAVGGVSPLPISLRAGSPLAHGKRVDLSHRAQDGSLYFFGGLRFLSGGSVFNHGVRLIRSPSAQRVPHPKRMSR